MAATLIVVAAIEMRMMNLENAPLGALANLPTILNESFNPLCLLVKIQINY